MRTLAPKPRSLAIAVVAAAVASGALLGCGDDDNGTSTGSTAPTGSSTESTTTGKQGTITGEEKDTGKQSSGPTTIGTMGKGGSNEAPVAKLRGKVKGGEKSQDALQVASDDSVSLIAKVENASKRPRVRVVIPRGPASEITVALGPLKGDPASSITLRATDGTFEVDRLRWPCAVPPYTFCPVQTIESKDAYTLRMVTGKDGKIAVKLDLKPEKKPQSSGTK